MSRHAKDHINLFITSICYCGLVSHGQPVLATQKRALIWTYTLSSDSEAANLANSCQKLARNIFTAYKNSLTGNSPYDLGESHNLYVWGSSAVNYRDARNIMNEKHNSIVQEYQTNYFIIPKFMFYSYFHMLENRVEEEKRKEQQNETTKLKTKKVRKQLT